MEMEQYIINFFKCSLADDFDDFDWTGAFETYIPFLERNCIAHGQGTYEEFEQRMDDIYGLNSLECDMPRWAVIETDWISFSDVDACQAILKAQYECLRNTFKNNVHSNNAELLERARNHRYINDLPELIALFDECIHAQHATGDIIDDCDPDALRKIAEEEYNDEKTEFATCIRDFL
jgi:hypothetical protein